MGDEELAETGLNAFRIFQFWQRVMDKPRAKFLPERARAIKARLREGYSVTDIEDAILGCKDSAFHQGQNDSHTVYDDITLICRRGTNVERFKQYRRTLRPEERAAKIASTQRLREALDSQDEAVRAREARAAEAAGKTKAAHEERIRAIQASLFPPSQQKAS